MRFETKDFILRPISIKDLKEFFEIQQEREIQKGFMSAPKTLNEARNKLKNKVIAKRKNTGETFAIEVNGKFAGFIELHDLNEPYFKHKGVIGYCIAKEFRGKGITTKAVKIIIKYAFKKYKLKRLEAVCRDFNKASARLLEKSGFKLEGIMKKNKYKNGKYLNDMIWAIVK